MRETMWNLLFAKREAAQPSLIQLAQPIDRRTMIGTCFTGVAGVFLSKGARAQEGSLTPTPLEKGLPIAPMPDAMFDTFEPADVGFQNFIPVQSQIVKAQVIALAELPMKARPVAGKNIDRRLVNGFDRLNAKVWQVMEGTKIVCGLHNEVVKIIDLVQMDQAVLRKQVDDLFEDLGEHKKKITEMIDFMLKVHKWIDRMGIEACKTNGMLNQLACMIQQALCMACGLGDAIRKARMVSFLFGLAIGVGIGIGVGGGGGGGAALTTSIW